MTPRTRLPRAILAHRGASRHAFFCDRAQGDIHVCPSAPHICSWQRSRRGLHPQHGGYELIITLPSSLSQFHRMSMLCSLPLTSHMPW